VGASMSMVGPRPALPHEVATFDNDLLGRHSVPPGVTGSGRSRLATTRRSMPTATSTCSTSRTGPALSTSWSWRRPRRISWPGRCAASSGGRPRTVRPSRLPGNEP
jgi:hypothetical protein